MLCKLNMQKSSNYFVEGSVEGEEEEVLTWDGGSGGNFTIGGELTTEQRGELEYIILEKHQCTLTKVPGLTTQVNHTIETGDSPPIHPQPYRLPHAYRDRVKCETQEMLQQGIIEPSSSDWAVFMVIVKITDGTIRLCVDYRHLSTVTRVDTYPMPRIDDLIDLVRRGIF